MLKTYVFVIAILLITLVNMAIITTSRVEALKLSSINIGITIDGDPVEWGDWTCPSFPTPDGNYGAWFLETINNIPQWIWCDAPGDERTDFSRPDKRADLVQFRITGDTDFLYLLFIFNDTSGFNIGDDGGTFIALTINRNGTGANSWFSGDSDTDVHENARWAYQVVINLADSRHRDKGKRSTIEGPYGNWGAIFYILNPERNFITNNDALMGANVDKNTVEIRIPWDTIGGAPSGPQFYLRLSLITGRGWSNFDNNQGGAWDISESKVSDALDAMTITGPNTWDEVQDKVVDYYVDVFFTTTPPYYPIPEPGLIVAIASVATAGIGVFYGLRKKYTTGSQGD